MLNFESGVLSRARLFSNFLLIVLLAGNIFFSIQYVANLQQTSAQEDTKTVTRFQIARFLKFFVDTVLNTQGTISYEDRVKLENDVRQIGDADIIRQWDTFVASKGAKEAQESAVKLMSTLTNKML